MSFACETCKTKYPFKETAELCCTDRGGCGKKDTPAAVLTYVCGDSVKDGKWWFCKECRHKKMSAWRTAKVIEGEDWD